LAASDLFFILNLLNMPHFSTDSAATTRENTTSLFQDHLLEPAAIKPEIHFTQYDYTVFGILFLAFVMFVWLYAANRKRLNQVLRSFYAGRFSTQSREELSIGNRVSIFLSLLFIITMSLFALQVNRHYQLVDLPETVLLFLFIAMIIVLTYLGKVLVVRFFGFVFQTSKEAVEYLHSLFLFGNTLGIFMMPVVICLAFARNLPPVFFIYTGFGLIVTFLCARLVRGFIIGMNSARVSRFYLFLYLCTLEILPFIVLVKLFILKIK
jgi:hypothetical protein